MKCYGFRAPWAPLQNITCISWESALQSVTIRLLGDHSVRVPVPEELRSEAEQFARYGLPANRDHTANLGDYNSALRHQ